MADPKEPASEHSYGIIPIRPITASAALTAKNTQVLLIHQKTAAPHLPWFWSFPKGHPEPDDAGPLQTALRELKEETGLVLRDGEAGVLFGHERALLERYINPLKGWVKEVRYWVGVVDEVHARPEDGLGEQINVQVAELAGAKWCSWEEAAELVTFERGKETLKVVSQLLG